MKMPILIELETKTASTLTAFHLCSRTEHPLEGCWEHVQNNQENMILTRVKAPIKDECIFFRVCTTNYPLWSRSIYQNAAFCLAILFSYIAQPKGGGEECIRYTYCAHAHARTDVQSLTSYSSSSMRSKKIMR